jgi:hypothetical protein
MGRSVGNKSGSEEAERHGKPIEGRVWIRAVTAMLAVFSLRNRYFASNEDEVASIILGLSSS